MGKKEQCKQIMTRLFGKIAAAQVEDMSEDNCVSQCREMTVNFLGETTAQKEFDGL